MADERIAELIAQSNVALADSLAKALQGVRGQSAPNVQLSKFVGHPRKSGDPTLSEWLEEFEIYIRQRAIPEEEQAMTLLDHLGGSARDEVLCHPLSVRQDLASLTTLLRVRFGKHSISKCCFSLPVSVGRGELGRIQPSPDADS